VRARLREQRREMAMVVEVGALATSAAAAAGCRHGAVSSSAPCGVGMGGGHSLPVCRGLRKVSAATKRVEPVGVQSRASRSTGIVAEVQEAASPG
jgi:hypothetical protein